MANGFASFFSSLAQAPSIQQNARFVGQRLHDQAQAQQLAAALSGAREQGQELANERLAQANAALTVNNLSRYFMDQGDSPQVARDHAVAAIASGIKDYSGFSSGALNTQAGRYRGEAANLFANPTPANLQLGAQFAALGGTTPQKLTQNAGGSLIAPFLAPAANANAPTTPVAAANLDLAHAKLAQALTLAHEKAAQPKPLTPKDKITLGMNAYKAQFGYSDNPPDPKAFVNYMFPNTFPGVPAWNPVSAAQSPGLFSRIGDFFTGHHEQPQAAPARSAAAKSGKWPSAAAVKQAYQAGKLSAEQAKQILQSQFGYTP